MTKLKAALALLRPHQWIKNAFVLAPLCFSDRFFESAAWFGAALVAVLFSLASSSVYVLNDLCDAEADRAHKEKCTRPIASGAIGLLEALAVLAGLLGTMAAIIVWGNVSFSAVKMVGLFLFVNLGYSLGMKRLALWEMAMVASGYVVRVIAGSIAVDRIPSEWIIVCAGTLAMLIVAGKRREEVASNPDFSSQRLPYRNYSVAFLDKLVVILASTTLVSYLLFTVSDYAHQRFGEPKIMLTTVFVAMGVFRYVQIIIDEQGAGAPSRLVVRDKTLILSVVFWAATFYALMHL